MSLIVRHIALLFLAAIAFVPASGQVFNEAGLTSGTGLTFMPTPALAPLGHWRAHYARVDYLGSQLRGFNVMGFGFGLSHAVEGYVRVSGEQLGTVSSLTSYGFGFKGTLPWALPIVDRLGAWYEAQTTQDEVSSALFPTKGARGGLLAAVGDTTVRTTFLVGVNSRSGAENFLAGAAVIWAPAAAVQVAAEAISGYAGEGTSVAALDVSLRVLSHLVVVASPAYVTTGPMQTWTMSVGICAFTAPVDFRPGAIVARKGDFKLPSLEDIMKDSSEEPKQ
jgi:hypothetical protein